MNQDERLALAVRAQVAQIRHAQAEERGALLERQVAPLIAAADRFRVLYGREWSPSVPSDAVVLVPILRATGGADIPPEMVQAASDAKVEIRELATQAMGAMDALLTAWNQTGATPLEWVGVPQDLFDRAVADAMLAEES